MDKKIYLFSAIDNVELRKSNKSLHDVEGMCLQSNIRKNKIINLHYIFQGY